MAEFKIDGRMTVRTLKENFKNTFEGTLRVYDGREKADDNATLASIRKNDVKTGEYVCRGSRTVGKFIEEMEEVFGISIKVASPDDWVLALDGITLANLKNIKKNSTKADMEELVAYKRKGEEMDEEDYDDDYDDDDENDKFEIKDGVCIIPELQEKKYFNIFMHHIGGKCGTFDKDEMLEALDYKDLDEMWEEFSTGLAGECDDFEAFIYKVRSIYVEESKTKLENPFLDHEGDGDTYDDGFEVDYFEVPNKGYVVEYYEGTLTSAFIIEVDASEEFDIEELCVNSENEITYKGEKYSSVADDCGSSCGYGGRLSYDGEVLYDDIDSGLDDDDDDWDDDDDDWDDDDWD
jgi:hypothetical protein